MGFGRWGQVYAKTIDAMDGVRLSALASTNPDSRNLAPRGCSIEPDWRRVISEGGLDGLVLAVPPLAQTEIAAVAMEAGLAVLLEKPLALDTANAQRLVRAAREHRSFAMVDHTHLFHPAYQELKKRLVEIGGAGQVRAITAEAGNWGPFRPATRVLWDWGAHDVAMVLDIMQRNPLSVSASILARQSQEDGIGETIEIRMEFESCQARISLDNMRAEKWRRFDVQAVGLEFRYDGVAGENFACKSRAAANWQTEVIPGPPPLQIAVAEFADGIRAGAANWDPLIFGAKVVAILERCQQSLDPGGPAAI